MQCFSVWDGINGEKKETATDVIPKKQKPEKDEGEDKEDKLRKIDNLEKNLFQCLRLWSLNISNHHAQKNPHEPRFWPDYRQILLPRTEPRNHLKR